MLSLKEDTMLGNVPPDWDIKPLKALLAEHYPGDWGDESGPEMFNVLRSTNLTASGHLDLHDIASRALNPKTAEKLQLLRNDLLLERSGGGPEQPVGRIGFVETELERTAFSNFLHMLRPDPEEVDPRYLGWMLWRINQTGRILRLEQQTTQMRNLHFRDYLQMPLPIPPPGEQAAIARILDAVETVIERTQQVVAALVDLEYSLLHELLGQGEDLPATKVGRAVKTCKRQRVDEVAEVGSGVTLGKDLSGVRYAELPYLRVANVQDGHLDLETIKTVRVPVRDVDRYRLQVGDVLMTEGGDIDKLGRGTIWHGQIENCLHQNHIFRVRADRDKLEPRYFAWVVHSNIAKAYFIRVAKRTTNLASINKTQLRAFRFPVPELEDQRFIADTMEAARATTEGHNATMGALVDLKRSLMHDLLTGKVRTDRLKLDEVAA